MISVLVIGGADDDKAAFAAGSPSLEVLTAHGLEDALEKLGRNRRIDAVLLLDRRDAREIVEAIRQDIPAHPPIYVPGPARDAPAGTRPLPAAGAEQLLKLLARAIEAIRQDIPAHPPIYVPGPARDAPAGTCPLPAAGAEQLLKLLARAIEA